MQILINSYKRFESNSFSPTSITAADDNRTVAVRSLLNKGAQSRLEYRLGSSDANPYLVTAAGINGLENKLYISKSLDGQAYVKRATVVPKGLSEAINIFESNKIAKEYFGEEFVKVYVQLGRHEVEHYNLAVTDWERKRYLEMV